MASPGCADPTPTPVTSFNRGALAVAAEGCDVYWIAPFSALAGVYRAPRTGGDATQLASVLSFQDDAYDWGLAVDGGIAFFAETGDAGISPHVGRVARVDGAGHVTELARGQPLPCRSGGHPRRVTLDATHVYWTEDSGRFIGDLDDPGLPPDPVCHTTADFRWVRSVPKGGGVARTLAQISSLNVAVDERFIYYTRGDALLRLDKRSLEEKVVVSGLAFDQGIGRETVLHQAGAAIYVGGHDGCLYTVQRQNGLVRTVCPGPESTQGRVIALASD
ncbi:MAG TPA: hypothetical protein VH877_22205, partial [Polyangia bacterium]|nr:hypothetical protein [Polyangia bacterium]